MPPHIITPIRAALRSVGLSQGAAADLLGLDRGVVSRALSRSAGDIRVLVALLAAIAVRYGADQARDVVAEAARDGTGADAPARQAVGLLAVIAARHGADAVACLADDLRRLLGEDALSLQ